MMTYIQYTLSIFVLLVVISFTTTSHAQPGDDSPNQTTVFAILPEAPGDNCETGGSVIASGLDTNGNGKLNFNEVQQVGYACNGLDGTDGTDGAPGAEGPPGPAGPPGPGNVITVENTLPYSITCDGGFDEDDNVTVQCPVDTYIIGGKCEIDPPAEFLDSPIVELRPLIRGYGSNGIETFSTTTGSNNCTVSCFNAPGNQTRGGTLTAIAVCLEVVEDM